jgi:hypothetical protein
MHLANEIAELLVVIILGDVGVLETDCFGRVLWLPRIWFLIAASITLGAVPRIVAVLLAVASVVAVIVALRVAFTMGVAVPQIVVEMTVIVPRVTVAIVIALSQVPIAWCIAIPPIVVAGIVTITVASLVVVPVVVVPGVEVASLVVTPRIEVASIILTPRVRSSSFFVTAAPLQGAIELSIWKIPPSSFKCVLKVVGLVFRVIGLHSVKAVVDDFAVFRVEAFEELGIAIFFREGLCRA